MLFNVTQEDIDKARAELSKPLFERENRAKCCPVAQCIRREYPDSYVAVGFTDVEINSNIYDLPNHMSNFIADFDSSSNDLVKPTEFELDLDNPRPIIL
jgi:hypothetical protein